MLSRLVQRSVQGLHTEHATSNARETGVIVCLVAAKWAAPATIVYKLPAWGKLHSRTSSAHYVMQGTAPSCDAVGAQLLLLLLLLCQSLACLLLGCATRCTLPTAP